MNWYRFAEIRPIHLGHHWFRLSAYKWMGVTCTPTWIDEIHSCGMGYSNPEPWPIFSYWNGYQRTIHPDLEWRPLTDPERALYLVEPKNNRPYLLGHNDRLHIPELTLLPCPFCGSEPRLTTYDGYAGSAPFQDRKIGIHCDGCRMCESNGYTNLETLQKRWNQRCHATL